MWFQLQVVLWKYISSCPYGELPGMWFQLQVVLWKYISSSLSWRITWHVVSTLRGPLKVHIILSVMGNYLACGFNSEGSFESTYHPVCYGELPGMWCQLRGVLWKYISSCLLWGITWHVVSTPSGPLKAHIILSVLGIPWHVVTTFSSPLKVHIILSVMENYLACGFTLVFLWKYISSCLLWGITWHVVSTPSGPLKVHIIPSVMGNYLACGFNS